MKTSELHASSFFDLSQTKADTLLLAVQYPWQVLAQIQRFVLELGPQLPKSDFEHITETIWVAKTAKIATNASLNGPLIIGHETEVRHCAYIRGSVLIGDGCVIGNSTELKNVILMNHVQVPHYNYVGDSILGYKAHMGAGSITSNVKSDKSLIVVRTGHEKLETGLKKFGAILGDRVEVGCNSVLNPGSIVGPNSQIYPLSMVRGIVPANSIYKKAGEVVALK
ncbi:MAG: UDP-N-acetylglucosamine pyrophosphorylase [Eubacteriales bacterium]|nr:UDP-N-acetylglucosamine pyrophosphorylase [Eubacteriales bacterium]